MYIFNNGCDLWDDNGKISIQRFNDKIPNLNDSIMCTYIYQIISKEKAIEEINIKEKQKTIQRLENELERLKKEVK